MRVYVKGLWTIYAPDIMLNGREGSLGDWEGKGLVDSLLVNLAGKCFMLVLYIEIESSLGQLPFFL